MLAARPRTICVNPQMSNYTTSYVMFLIILILFSALSLINIFDFITNPSSVSVSQFLTRGASPMLQLLLNTVAFVSIALRRLYWKRIERRRFAAAAGAYPLSIHQQPGANPVAFPLPCTITLRPNNKFILLSLGVAVAYAFLFAGTFAWFNNNFQFISPDRLHNFLVVFAVTVTTMIIIILSAVFFSSRQKVTVTEQGIYTNYGGSKGVVQWEEAQLFAMYNTFGAEKSGAAITYELSSTTEIVRWAWVLRPDLVRVNMVPTIPFDEYHQQIHALNALVVARTGLPLYDLRAEPAARSFNATGANHIR